MRTSLLGAAMILATCGAAHAAAPAKKDQVYRLDHVTALKGAQPAWDYLSLDPASGHLFIGRRAGGVTVYDVKLRNVIGQVGNSAGANIGLPIPQAGKGFTANGDGSTTVFDLKTFKAIKRIKLGDGADAVFYEPKTRQVMFTMGDTQQVAFMDAGSTRITGYLHIDAKQIEGAAADGKGALFFALRDKDILAKVDAASRSLTAQWPIKGCSQPTGVAYDPATDRVFVGCKGEHPVLSVLDGTDGRVVAQLDIGRGNDGVKFDAASRKVFTSNGVDGNLVIFDQLGADSYRLNQAVTTRPIARTLAIDPGGKHVWTVTAQGMVDPSKPVNRAAAPFYPNLYFDNTFTLLEYGLHTKPKAGDVDD